jgi:phosphotransferase system enzyme I (PtsI)
VNRHAGTGASTGIAIGPARLLAPAVRVEERRIGADSIPAELARFEAAIATTDAAMEQIAQAAAQAPPEIGTDMVETHRAILRSDEIIGETRTLIRERRLGAEWAVRLVVDELRPLFAAMKDARFAERIGDVEAVTDRLLRALMTLPEIDFEGLEGHIGIAYELSPLDALQLHRAGVAGFVTERGGPTSHAAIVARTLGIPYVFGVDGLLDTVRSDDTVCIDGAEGDVVIAPDAATEALFERRRVDAAERRRIAEATIHSPAVTLDGTRISLGANVESADEVAAAVVAGADHIGLVRTELLYLDRAELPSEEEQLRDALLILAAAGGRTVTFRTLDIGGDKLPLSERIGVGPNPSLGMRGIRYSLRRIDVFRTQLRALFRAAASSPMRIMFPLVSSSDEVYEARRLCLEVCGELSRAGVPHGSGIPVGAMIETPSAALTADHIAAVADFVSLGTNDLVHYAFAADRQNQQVAYLYRPLHPSILRLLRQVLDTTAARGCPISLCGDMAGDPRFTWLLLGLGLRTFSMAAPQLPFVRSVVQRSALPDALRLASDALLLESDVAIAALASDRMAAGPTMHSAMMEVKD